MTKIRVTPERRALPPTHYQVIGLPPAASFEELHDAYRALAIRLHPDHGGDMEEFKRLSLAWGVLRNTVSRKNYDNELRLERGICSKCLGSGVTSTFRKGKFLKNVRCDGDCKGDGYL